MTDPTAQPENQHGNGSPPRLAVITCAVLEEEIRHFVQGLDHVVHVEILAQGLHNEPPKLRLELQAAIDRVENMPGIDPQAIVLGYGLCSRGIEGVRTRRCKLVLARAHDCITLLLGDKDRYAEYVSRNPGTYWYSPGWNRHHIPPGKERYDKLYQGYAEKYGEDNAEYLMQMEQKWLSEYNRATYVDLSVGVTDQDLAYTRQCAQWLGWSYDHQRGDTDLIRAMLAGRWDERRFVVLPPGRTMRMTADERVLEPADASEYDASLRPTSDHEKAHSTGN